MLLQSLRFHVCQSFGVQMILLAWVIHHLWLLQFSLPPLTQRMRIKGGAFKGIQFRIDYCQVSYSPRIVQL